tara:strand:- start:1884 stop:3746 length:1863 start_codon:yes stop_codon:yes gene_type:complete
VAVLDQYGNPIAANVKAKFDLAQTTAHNRRHWANADNMAARAAMSPAVRTIVRKRSRYEFDNNSWYSGMLRTASNHIVGCGPRLQVLSDDSESNTRLEKAWRKWSRSVNLAEKLRVMMETYWKDGEVFAVRSRRDDLFPISLDINLIEAEQCASPFAGDPAGDPLIDDGVRFDASRNGAAYYIYDNHPGDTGFLSTFEGDWYDSSQVVHLFRRERPGQSRGIPRATCALNTLPIMRRQEMATLLAAETAASFATYLKSTSSALDPTNSPADFAEIEIAYNMMTTLPAGWDIAQVDGKHPGPQYEMFQRSALTSFCRCTNMPYALAAGTSRDSNFSSLKGDMKNVWQPEVEVEQDRIELIVIEQIWHWFLEEAVFAPDLLDGLPSIEDIDHQWYWAPLPNLDEVDSANAANLRLDSGQSVPSTEYARRGLDYETELKKAANDYGVEESQFKKAVFDLRFESAAASAVTVSTGDASEPVANTAMNGAQVTSIVTILTQVADQVLPPSTARGLIRSAFPSIPNELIDAMLTPFAAMPSEVQPPATQPDGGPIPAAVGEYTELGQRAFVNNQKRIAKTLETLAAGEMSRVMAEQTLQSIGLSDERILALIDDALTGDVLPEVVT